MKSIIYLWTVAPWSETFRAARDPHRKLPKNKYSMVATFSLPVAFGVLGIIYGWYGQAVDWDGVLCLPAIAVSAHLFILYSWHIIRWAERRTWGASPPPESVLSAEKATTDNVIVVVDSPRRKSSGGGLIWLLLLAVGAIMALADSWGRMPWTW